MDHSNRGARLWDGSSSSSGMVNFCKNDDPRTTSPAPRQRSSLGESRTPRGGAGWALPPPAYSPNMDALSDDDDDRTATPDAEPRAPPPFEELLELSG
eukprot:6180876-Prymnesium_polylepis.1